MTDAGLLEFLETQPDFTILGTLGRGGMGTVYMAEQVRLGRKVAVKVLQGPFAEDPRARERFLRETRAVASIDHPGVLPIYDAGEAGTALYTIMRFVDGPDLRNFLNENGRQSLDVVRQFGSQIAAALGAAHARGLVHRDVKPANILLASFDVSGIHTYLCDFGLAKRLDSGPSLTKMDEIVGTVDYIAPEQIESGPVDARTDMYSLGCLVFEMLVGHPPFRGSSDLAVLWSHLRDAPPSVRAERPELPRGLDELLQSAMAKSPDDRPSGSAEFVRRLLAEDRIETAVPDPVPETQSHTVFEARSDLGSPAESSGGSSSGGSGGGSDGGSDGGSGGVPADSPIEVSRHPRRRRWLIAAGGFVILAAVGVTLGLTIGKGSPPASPNMNSMGSGSGSSGNAEMVFTGGKTGPLTAGETRLLSALNPDMQKYGHCQADRFSQGDWAGTVGGLSCTWPHADIPVIYIQFPNDSTMNDHFEDLVTAHNFSQTNCAKSSTFSAVQVQSGPNPVKRFNSENISTLPAAPSDLLCLQSHGVPELIWTNDGFHVLAEASAGSGVTREDLLEFYGFQAGPYGTP